MDVDNEEIISQQNLTALALDNISDIQINQDRARSGGMF